MKTIRMISAAALLAALLSAAPAAAEPKMAFGYLVNRSNDPNYGYLETILPNAFASSMRNNIRSTVINPLQIGHMLQKRHLRFEKDYRPEELPELTAVLSADYFIYGNFTVLPGDSLKINLRLYCRDLNRILTFTTTGKMEIEIFRLVDRITKSITDFMGRDALFYTRVVPAGSRIGVLTNLSGYELNWLYHCLMAGGYKITGMQGNTLVNAVPDNMMDGFLQITGEENSYEMISDPTKLTSFPEPGIGPRFGKKIMDARDLYRLYDTDYIRTKFAVLDRLARYYDITTLLIIRFNGMRNRAWVRCIDLRTRNLIWMQAGVTGSIPDICSALIRRMTAEVSKR